MDKELNFEELEKALPKYLKHDIEELVKNMNNPECSFYDCLLDELYGSINSAQWGNEISIEMADYLRKKYIFVDED